MTDSETGKRLAKIRKAAGWMQADVAIALQISPSVWGLIEIGRYRISDKLILAFEAALKGPKPSRPHARQKPTIRNCTDAERAQFDALCEEARNRLAACEAIRSGGPQETGKRLAGMRKAAGWAQADIALALGIRTSVWGMIEIGKMSLSDKRLRAFERALKGPKPFRPGSRHKITRPDFTPEECAQIRALYEAGQTREQLARRFSCKPTAICDAVRTAGGTLRIGRYPPCPDLTTQAEQEYRSGKTLREVAATLNCSHEAVRKLLRRSGADLRTRGMKVVKEETESE